MLTILGAGTLYWAVNGTIKSLDVNADAVEIIANAHMAILPLSVVRSSSISSNVAWLDLTRPGYVTVMTCSVYTLRRMSFGCEFDGRQVQLSAPDKIEHRPSHSDASYVFFFKKNTCSTTDTLASGLVATANGTYCVLTSNTGNVSCLTPPSYSAHSFLPLRGAHSYHSIERVLIVYRSSSVGIDVRFCH